MHNCDSGLTGEPRPGELNNFARSELFIVSNVEKPSVLDFVFTRIGAASAKKSKFPQKQMRTLLEEACEQYNQKMKHRRSHMITGPSRNFLYALAKCHKDTLKTLQAHYLNHKRKESGTELRKMC